MKPQERKFAHRKKFNLDVRDWFCMKHDLPLIPIKFLKRPVQFENRYRFGVFAIPDNENDDCPYCGTKATEGVHICLTLYSQKEFDDSLLIQGIHGYFKVELKTPVIFEELAHYLQYSMHELDGKKDANSLTWKEYRSHPIEKDAKTIALKAWAEWQREFPDRKGYL